MKQKLNRYIDRHHRILASPIMIISLIFLGISCLKIMSIFEISEGKPLDLFIFLSKAECLVTIRAWSQLGVKGTAFFYILDCVWAIIWNLSLYYVYNLVLKYRHSLLFLRIKFIGLFSLILALDYLENATIVMLAGSYPAISDLLFYISRGTTFLKWLGIVVFWALLIVSYLRTLKRKENKYA
ncbi:hypothetical protein KAR34_11805 [bacterium]|nr:hypothetical protein [bacterium]